MKLHKNYIEWHRQFLSQIINHNGQLWYYGANIKLDRFQVLNDRLLGLDFRLGFLDMLSIEFHHLVIWSHMNVIIFNSNI